MKARKELTHLGNKLKIGVFGGRRGKSEMEALLTHPDAELVAVCDRYEPCLDEVTKIAEDLHATVACYNNFDDFLSHDMDAVVLANYATEHATYAIRCLQAGKHVLSEVLPCETMAQAVELVEAVESSGKVYAYAENYCYMQGPFEMWRRYRNGDIGEVMYGEGEYIHDCTDGWPSLTYGDRSHWRNNMLPTYYCTHSLGPLLTMTGQRPVSVVGFETPPFDNAESYGYYYGAGIELVTLENGAVLKSAHGHLKRPASYNWELYGQKGMMETGRLAPLDPLNVYREGVQVDGGDWEHYAPEKFIMPELANKHSGHNGSDFYPTHFFIEKILGRPDGEWSIDVYQAVSMGICGLLAYRSILNGNHAVEIPDFRIPSERDLYRRDNACTNPKIAGDQLLPRSSFGNPDIPDAVYDKVREDWLKSLEK